MMLSRCRLISTYLISSEMRFSDSNMFFHTANLKVVWEISSATNFFSYLNSDFELFGTN